MDYADVYKVITSTDFSIIRKIMRTINVPVLERGLREFYERLPSKISGMNECDQHILAYLQRQTNPVRDMRVLAEILCIDRYDCFSEQYTFGRIRKMLDTTCPPLVRDGEGDEGKLQINKFGRALLEEQANWLDHNSIKYEVGGVVLDSAKDQLVFQEDTY